MAGSGTARRAVDRALTALETRPSRSRADMGFVTFRYELFGQSERRLMTLTVIPMFGRRDAAGAATDAQSRS